MAARVRRRMAPRERLAGSYRLLLGLVALCASSACSSPPPQGPVEHPNIVLVIGDDHGYPYYGFMGDKTVRTPNLDRLAREGTLFTTAYVTASKCEPSLRSLLTGREPFPRGDPRKPVPGAKKPGPPSQETLPGLLAQRGYASFQAGKLWQGSFSRAGFTEGTKTGNDQGSPVQRWMGGVEGLRVGRETMQPVFDFIDRHKDGPFFLWFAPMLPHRPWDAPREIRERYAGLELSESARAYYANISRFDDALGELVAYIDEKGLRARTLIVYLSDNGFRQGPQDHFSPEEEHRGKGTMSEFGFRTPLIFNWPGHITAGVVRTDLVSSLDLFPTLLDYAGVPAPPDRVGMDLRTMLEKGTPVPRAALIGHMDSVRSHEEKASDKVEVSDAYFLRDSKWHYVWYPKLGNDQLYDVENDSAEQKNVLGDHPEVVAELRSKIERWRDEAKAPSP